MGSSDRPGAKIRTIVVDCTDIEASARFWGTLLGMEVAGRFEEYLFFEDFTPGLRLTLQQVDRVTPDKTPVHFDLVPDDGPAFLAFAAELGATRIAEVDHPEYRLVVLADPDGNEFCVDLETSDLLEGRSVEPPRSEAQ